MKAFKVFDTSVEKININIILKIVKLLENNSFEIKSI